MLFVVLAEVCWEVIYDVRSTVLAGFGVRLSEGGDKHGRHENRYNTYCTGKLTMLGTMMSDDDVPKKKISFVCRRVGMSTKVSRHCGARAFPSASA